MKIAPVEQLFTIFNETALVLQEELSCTYLEALAETGENLFHGSILQEEVSELSSSARSCAARSSSSTGRATTWCYCAAPSLRTSARSSGRPSSTGSRQAMSSGNDLEHRRLRRVRRPGRHGRADPHLRSFWWTHVNHPSEVLEIGQPVKVKVLDIDRDRQRISLGLKQTQSDPWQQVLESYNQGDVVEGARHEGGHLRRLRRDHARRRRARAHLRACRAPRREPARGRLAGRHGQV